MIPNVTSFGPILIEILAKKLRIQSYSAPFVSECIFTGWELFDFIVIGKSSERFNRLNITVSPCIEMKSYHWWLLQIIWAPNFQLTCKQDLEPFNNHVMNDKNLQHISKSDFYYLFLASISKSWWYWRITSALQFLNDSISSSKFSPEMKMKTTKLHINNIICMFIPRIFTFLLLSFLSLIYCVSLFRTTSNYTLISHKNE